MKIGEEVVRYWSENIADLRYELNMYADGEIEAILLDGLIDREMVVITNIGADKVGEIAKRVISTIGDLKHGMVCGAGASESLIRAKYQEQEKGIGYNDRAPTEELEKLERELVHMTVETVHGNSGRKFIHDLKKLREETSKK